MIELDPPGPYLSYPERTSDGTRSDADRWQWILANSCQHCGEIIAEEWRTNLYGGDQEPGARTCPDCGIENVFAQLANVARFIGPGIHRNQRVETCEEALSQKVAVA